jgi:hypothetical protein
LTLLQNSVNSNDTIVVGGDDDDEVMWNEEMKGE